jgi:hypothetical protein
MSRRLLALGQSLARKPASGLSVADLRGERSENPKSRKTVVALRYKKKPPERAASMRVN